MKFLICSLLLALVSMVYDELSLDLQAFVDSLDLEDIFAFDRLFKDQDPVLTQRYALAFLKTMSPSTYKKMRKLVAVCKRRFAKMTVGARNFFRKYGNDALLAVNVFNNLSVEHGLEKWYKFVDAFDELSGEDQESIWEQFTIVYRFVADNDFLEAAVPQIEKAEKELADLLKRPMLVETGTYIKIKPDSTLPDLE
ncbi:unnamed protein product, partial [Mesorhabditis spiculigera]